MARSIIDTLSLAVTVAFAAPIGLAGANFFLRGDRALGAVMVALAFLMIAFEEYLIRPSDVPVEIAQTVVGGVVTDESEAATDEE
ncbi:hypothetical protein BRD00_05470 [Halobacteriales archaeon QS_8_69_26]|nr:MAG: hypothetical protein BRD00_05470 [Halobacteriales archaeon QS_8_69_26]